MTPHPSFTLRPTWRVARSMHHDGGEFASLVPMSEVVTDLMIEEEPMLFGASLKFAADSSGPLTRSFLSALDGKTVVVDSRSHMLMPGMYPCIPGWHVDELPRDSHGKPIADEALTGGPLHVLAVVGSTSMTQFLCGPVDLPCSAPDGTNLYKAWTDRINPQVASGALGTYTVKSGEVVTFGVGDLHRGVPAAERGWRWFIRATFGTRRSVENKIRKQTQVYLPDVEAGW